jgi:hypothetical protein
VCALIFIIKKSLLIRVVTSGTLHTPTNKCDIARAKLVKENIMRSGAFINIVPGSKNDKVSGAQWEDLILVLTEYSLLKLKTYAGTYMKGGGGRLLVNNLSRNQTLTLIFCFQLESHHECIH